MPVNEWHGGQDAFILSRDPSLIETVSQHIPRLKAFESFEGLFSLPESTLAPNILVDGTTGLEDALNATRALRNHSLTSQHNILFLCPVDETIIAAALDAGADDCLFIPLQLSLLHHHLRTALMPAIPKAYGRKAGDFINFIPVMMHGIDRNGIIHRANAKWLSILDYDPEDVLGRNMLEFLPDNLRGAMGQDLLRRLWHPEGGQNIPTRLISRDGGVIDVRMDTIQIETTTEPMCLIVSQDVTAYLHVENSLRQSRRQMQSVLDTMSELVLVLDTDGRYVQVATPRHPGLIAPAEQLMGRSIRETLDEELSTHLLAVIREALTSDETRHINYHIRIEDQVHWFDATVSPMQQDRVLLVARDVTDRRQSEIELRETTLRYEELFQAANDAILVIDIDSAKILEANAQAYSLLGYDRGELIGTSISEIENVSDTMHSDTISVGLRNTDHLILEQQYRRKDGSLIPVETSSRIISYGGRTVILSFARDISRRKAARHSEREQRLLAEALRDTAAILNQSLELKDVLRLVLENVSRVVPTECSNIMLIEDGIARMERHRNYEQVGFTPQEISAIEARVSDVPNYHWMVQHKQPLLIPDTHSPNVIWTKNPTSAWIQSWLGAPIIVDNEVIGFINLDSSKKDHFRPEHVDRLQAFANQAAVALRNARMYEHLQEYAAELEGHVQARTAALSATNEALKSQIGERKQAEAALQTERNMLRTLIDNLPDYIYVKSLENKPLLINETLERLLLEIGLSEEQINRGEITLDTSDSHLNEDEDRQLLKTGTPLINRQRQVVDENGQIITMLATKVPLRDAEGNIIGLVGVQRNITDLVQARQQLDQVLMSARCLLWMGGASSHSQMNIEIVNEDAAQTFLPLNTDGPSYTDAWLKSIDPEDRDRRSMIFATNLAMGRNAFSLELRCREADDSIRWLTEEVQIVHRQGTAWRAVGVCTDITARKQAEAALKRANDELEDRVERRTRELLEANTDLKQEISERQRAEEAERAARIVAESLRESGAALNQNLERDAVLDQILDGISKVVPYDAVNLILFEDNQVRVVRERGYATTVEHVGSVMMNWPHTQRMLATGEAYIIHDTHEDPLWSNTPGFEWVRNNITVPIIQDEQIIGMLKLDSASPNHFTREHVDWLTAFANQAGVAIRNAHLVDRIRRHAAEMEDTVRARTVELENERAQLHAILNAIRDGVVYEDLGGKRHYINRALSEMTQFSSEEWLHSDLDTQLYVMPSEELAELRSTADKAISRQGYWSGEVEMHRADGSIFDARLIRTEVRDSDERPIGMVTVIRDVSQAKQLEAQKARFIASASHELRTPIANMKTRLYLMRRQPDRFEEHLSVAQSVANWMQSLIEDMFDLSRFERGVIILSPEAVPLHEMLGDVVRYQQPEADRRQLKLEINLPNEPVIIEADPFRLTQVITNLLTNAIHYTPENGKIYISLEAQTDDGGEMEAVIRVRDTGPGIDPDNLRDLFKPFFRGGRTDNRGAGLGLAISQEIVQRHGGEICVESTLGEGSSFIVRLPAHPPQQENG